MDLRLKTASQRFDPKVGKLPECPKCGKEFSAPDMPLHLRLAHDELSPEEQRFLDEETTNRQVVQDQASASAMVEAEKAKAAEWAAVREQWRLDEEKKRQEQARGAGAKAAALAEDRYRASVEWAQAGVERTLPRLEAARGRASNSPSAQARAYVLYYEQALDGWQSTVKLYESREPFYRMNDRWSDILLASENYPSDKGNRYYWNKKGMPKIKALRKWTDIQVTRRDRNGLWEFPEEADTWTS